MGKKVQGWSGGVGRQLEEGKGVQFGVGGVVLPSNGVLIE